jgi:glycosyltransferase involved in cell wall biosynthesis
VALSIEIVKVPTTDDDADSLGLGEDFVPASSASALPAQLNRATCVIIPAFNEAHSIAAVVEAVQEALPSACVLVVNDGSTDATAVNATRAGAIVMNLAVNLGIGGAVQAGYRYAKRYGFRLAIQVDGDGQHDPAELSRLLAPILAGRADMTVGSRWLGRGDYTTSFVRRVAMRLLAWLVRRRVPGSFSDTTSGFRAVGPRGIALFADRYPTDFPEVESLVLAGRHSLAIEDVPVQMEPRRHGRSSIAGLRTGYYMLRVGINLLIGGFAPSTGYQQEPVA